MLRHERTAEWGRARVKTGEASQYVLSSFGGRKARPTNHLHIDVVTLDYYKKPPGRAIPVSKIRSVIEQFQGQEIGVQFEAHFKSPPESIPQLVRATRFSSSLKEIALATDSVSFSVTNAPIDRITWIEADDGGSIWTIIEASIRTTISDDYLVRGFELLKITYDRFVVGRSYA